ncbi:hypothetical protein ACNKHO_21045 [Shigella flexneri]
MERYLGGEELSEARDRSCSRQRASNNEIILVTCGSAFKNKGVQAMLDAVVDDRPSPVDVPAINGILDDGKDTRPSVTQVMTSRSCAGVKIATDPLVGNLTSPAFTRWVNSGYTILNSVKAARNVLPYRTDAREQT